LPFFSTAKLQAFGFKKMRCIISQNIKTPEKKKEISRHGLEDKRADVTAGGGGSIKLASQTRPLQNWVVQQQRNSSINQL